MELDWAEILTLLLGSGFVLSIVTALYNWQQSKAARDFEARKEAKDYYRNLYGKIAVLDELVSGYQRSLKKGKAKVFHVKDCLFVELSTEKILMEFKDAYVDFTNYYIAKKCEGYEMFVSTKLKKLLIMFWKGVRSFYEKEEKMKVKEEIDNVHLLAEKATNHMEELFGLTK
jgi:hypothetical protein